MELQGTKVTVVGLGHSGLATARLLVKRGARVTVNDARTADKLGKFAEEAGALGVTLELGGHSADKLADSELIVVSPGVPNLPEFALAVQKGVPIVGEIELASWFIDSTVIGITGTNGKSTVTTLIGEMSCTAVARGIRVPY